MFGRIKQLLNIHNHDWETIGKYTVTGYSIYNGNISKTYQEIQKCSICKKIRLQKVKYYV